MIGRSNGGNPVKAIAYISGIQITDPHTGEVFDFRISPYKRCIFYFPKMRPPGPKKFKSLSQQIARKEFSSFLI
jgi:hypothetical protein